MLWHVRECLCDSADDIVRRVIKRLQEVQCFYEILRQTMVGVGGGGGLPRRAREGNSPHAPPLRLGQSKIKNKGYYDDC